MKDYRIIEQDGITTIKYLNPVLFDWFAVLAKKIIETIPEKKENLFVNMEKCTLACPTEVFNEHLKDVM